MNKRVHSFLKGISPKVNTVALLEFELAYKNPAVQHLNNYTTGIPHACFEWETEIFIFCIYI